MSTITQEQTDTSKPPIPVPAESEPAALFRYSTWLHAGAGAEGCTDVDEDLGSNHCADRAHFHAWCRLPNPLQHAEIRERALAAKARRIRQLRDPSSDAYEILREELDTHRRAGDVGRAQVIEDLMSVDYWRDYYEAMREVAQIDADELTDPDSDEPPKLYAHIEDDQARLSRLEAMAADQRPADEYDELRRHVSGYNEAIESVLKQIVEPKRAALEHLDTEMLLEQLSDKRIASESLAEFRRIYEMHTWLSCAYTEPNGRPALANLAALEQAAPEVIAALQSTFSDLQRTSQGASGN